MRGRRAEAGRRRGDRRRRTADARHVRQEPQPHRDREDHRPRPGEKRLPPIHEPHPQRPQRRPLSRERPTPAPSASGGPTASAVTSPAASAATSGTIVDQAAGFQVTLPKGCRSLDLTGSASAGEAASLAGLLGTSTVDAQTYLETLRAILPAGVRLFALDTTTFDPTAKFATSLNLLRVPTGTATLDQLETANVASLESLSIIVKPIDHIRVTLPAGPAIRFTYGFRVANSGIANGIVQTTQYLIPVAGVQYIVTLSSGGPPTQQEQADFLAVARSFTVLP